MFMSMVDYPEKDYNLIDNSINKISSENTDAVKLTAQPFLCHKYLRDTY